MESDKSFDNPIFSFLSLCKDLRLIFHQIAEWILDIKNVSTKKLVISNIDNVYLKYLEIPRFQNYLIGIFISIQSYFGKKSNIICLVLTTKTSSMKFHNCHNVIQGGMQIGQSSTFAEAFNTARAAAYEIFQIIYR